jgi:hypothetical protein
LVIAVHRFKMFAVSRAIVLSTDGLALPMGNFRQPLILPPTSISGIGFSRDLNVWTLDGRVHRSPAVQALPPGLRSQQRAQRITRDLWTAVLILQGPQGPLRTVAEQRNPNRTRPNKYSDFPVWDPELDNTEA